MFAFPYFGQMEYKQRKWQIWVDTGGTFTDCIAQHPDGQMLRAKVLSSSHLRGQLLEREGPAVYHFTHQWPVEEDIFRGYKFKFLEKPEENLTIEYIDFSRDLLKLNRDISLNKVQSFEITSGEEAPVLAARIVTKTPLNKNFPALSMRLGSTKGTNALLEKKGAKVALLITRGFKDLVPIGNQQRPDLFQLNIPEPVLLYDRVFEVEERIGAQGEILQPLEVTELSSLIASFQKVKPEAVAVALMHSYRNPKHEQELKRALKKAKIPFISLSQELTPAIKFLPRTQTALVNAYLSPAIQQYLDHVYDGLVGDEGNKNASLLIMSSVGGLVSKASFRPKDSLLSGPAGGVVGAAVIAPPLGYSKVLTLDMGGTSTDAARYDGQYDYQYITKIAGIEMLSPSLSIETVAAGGGSICGFDGNKLRVGPESAGAMPGPACYGAGGPLTLTDVNLLLGKLETSSMGIPVHQSKAELEIKRLQEKIKLRTGIDYSIPELLEGFEKIADEKMADAIRKISIAKGFDPENYALLAFGGAGGLHACGVAEQLKIDTIILPFDAGLLSAYGMGMARVERMVQQQVLKKYTIVQDQLSDIVQQLYEQAKQLLLAEGFEENAVAKIATLVYLRFKGQESCLEINFTGPGDLPAQFREKYIGLFGHYPIQQELEVESVKVIMASKVDMPERNMHSPKKHYPKPDNLHQAAFSGEATPLYYWDKLKEGAIVAGPAILLNNTSTVYVANGWTLEVTTDKNALLRFQRVESQQAVQLKEAIALELFTNRFSAIAEEMGAQLQRTAFSVNIKERLDFSCAILDANAQLLVNAPHIPVHLGSLGICARLVLEKLPLNPGDVIITNHPKYGGSHLPDVTLIMAVYTDENELIVYLINRAHHAEIGGKRPGSMPPDAQTLAEGGVVIQPTYPVKTNELQWAEIANLLNEGPCTYS